MLQTKLQTKFKLFLKPCKKSQLSESNCDQQMVRKLLIFSPFMFIPGISATRSHDIFAIFLEINKILGNGFKNFYPFSMP